MWGKDAHVFAETIRESGLVEEGDSGVVMVSGGADSIALLLGLCQLLGPDRLLVLHVNYGLRDTADRDEEVVRETCGRLGVETVVHHAGPAEGNLQSWARDLRHGEAERLRRDRDFDWIAVGHNRSDLAETFLYRLAVSPGTRPLLAMPPRSGHLIRPLLALDRNDIRRLFSPPWSYAEDPTNSDPRFARNRIREQVIPALEGVNPAAELNIVRTRQELAEDEDALMLEAKNLLPGEIEAVDRQLLEAQHPAIRRRLLRHLAEAGLGRPVAVPPDLASEALRLAASPEGGRLDLGGGDSFLIEAGRIRVLSGGGTSAGEPPQAVRVDLQEGTAVFGEWQVSSGPTSEAEARGLFGDPWMAFIDSCDFLEWSVERSPGVDDLLLELRPWRAGDRIEPLGMRGSKSLQDVFTDARVPASRRRNWPVLASGETVLWVPGLVRSRQFLIGGPDKPVLRLEATPPSGI